MNRPALPPEGAAGESASQPLAEAVPRTEPGTPPPGADVRRLHPATLFQNIVLSLPAFFFLLLPLLRGGDTTSWFNLVFAILYGVLAVPALVAQYLRFRYWLTPEELVIVSGVFNRQHRSIPVERVQNVQIEQSLLPRALGTAKVRVETAGSGAAEGDLQYVGLKEAQRIRQTIRDFQRRASKEAQPAQTSEQAVTASLDAQLPAIDQAVGEATSATIGTTMDDEREERLLWQMPLREVLLAGAYRFSLLYIALSFSLLQYIDPDPAAALDWLARGFYEPYVEAARDSPWVAVSSGIVLAVLLSWTAGIVTSLNRYYGFRLTEESGKMHVRYGLLTRKEGTIPLRRVQAVLMRANALMARHGWTRAEAQVMGGDPNQQGNRVAVPFGKLDEVWRTVVPVIREDAPAAPPEAWHSVSRLTIRRTIVRGMIVVVLAVAPLAYWASPWFLLGLLLVLPLWIYARARYKRIGYHFDGRSLVVRRGVFFRTIWLLPVEKFQVFYQQSTYFQRRLGLATVFVDTAGAASIGAAHIPDLPEDGATALVERLHAAFTSPEPVPREIGAAEPGEVEPDETEPSPLVTDDAERATGEEGVFPEPARAPGPSIADFEPPAPSRVHSSPNEPTDVPRIDPTPPDGAQS